MGEEEKKGGRIGEGASLTADTLRAHPPTVFQPSLRLMFLFTFRFVCFKLNE